MKRFLKIIPAVLVLLLAAYWMPFVTVNISADGNTYRVPFASSVEKDADGQVTFTSPRSAYALAKDADNAMFAYGEVKCRGNTYYYDEENDRSYYDVEVSSGIPSRFSYYYEKGNACAGWTEDDEIMWPYGDPKDVDLEKVDVEAVVSDEDAPWFVIENGEARNLYLYNEHFRMFKQGVMCYFRTMVIEGNERKLIDIQLLTPDAGAFYIRTNNAEGVEEGHYARVTETDIGGETWMCAYKKQWEGEPPVPLFKVVKE